MHLLLLHLIGCFFYAQPPLCEDPHLYYAPDLSGDVYFGCSPPAGWKLDPPDETFYATGSSGAAKGVPATLSEDDADDTGFYVPPGTQPTRPEPEDTAALPDTGDDLQDTGWDTGIEDTGWDTGVQEKKKQRRKPPDSADTGWQDDTAGDTGWDDAGWDGQGPDDLPPDTGFLPDDFEDTADTGVLE